MTSSICGNVLSEELPPMTMQVGMVGTNGVLIAGDMKHSNFTTYPRVTYNSTKVVLHASVAISCARSMETAKHFARSVIDKVDDWRHPQDAIVRIGTEVLRSAANGRDDIHCIVAVSGDTPRLFFAHSEVVRGSMELLCDPIDTFVFAGDTCNPAVFFAEMYYANRPIVELLPLAGHLVNMAHRMNTATIDGLEIVLCDRSGVHLLEGDYVKRLRSASDQWSQEIGKMFLGFK